MNNEFLIQQRFPKKQNFYKPAVNFQVSRRLFDIATVKWDNKFYDENRKLIKKGSKRISIQMMETYYALLHKMNVELKKDNHKSFDSVKNNYYTNPYGFHVRTIDLKNLLQQTFSTKNIKITSGIVSEKALEELFEGLRLKQTKIQASTIKSHLNRLVEAGMITKQYKRSKYGYYIIINPKLLRFSETFTQNTNSLKSDICKSKISETSLITINNNTIINNNKTNQHTDFSLMNGLHANQKNNNLHLEKTTRVNNGVSVEIDKNNIEKGLSSAEQSNVSAKETKKINDFKKFKMKIIANLYIFMLNTIFPDKSFDYNPENSGSQYFKYTLQSIKELTDNPIYFGNCKTIEDFEKKDKWLRYVIENTQKGWVEKRKGFNKDFLYPNRYILNNNTKFNFAPSIKYYKDKLKNAKKYNSHKKTEKKFTKKQFLSSLNIVAKLVNYDDTILKDPKFQRFVKVRFQNERYVCKANFDYETYRYMQYFIKISRTAKIN